MTQKNVAQFLVCADSKQLYIYIAFSLDIKILERKNKILWVIAYRDVRCWTCHTHRSI
jgi:hypothetical protein